MSSFAVFILLLVSSFLGVHPVPQQGLEGWDIERSWERVGDYSKFVATNKKIPNLCSTMRGMSVHFPIVIQGSQEFFVDGRSVARFGDPTFRQVQSFYVKPQVDCSVLAQGSELRWEVTSYSQYFARIGMAPEIAPPSRLYSFFSEGLHSLAGGILIVLGAFTLIVAWGKVPVRMLGSFALSTFALALYFMCMTPAFYGINGSMLALHKIADFSLWVGTVGIFLFLYEQKLVKRELLQLFSISAALAVLVIVFAPDGDVAQLGTTLPFLVAPIVLLGSLFSLWRVYKAGEKLSLTMLKLTEISIFSIAAMSDILFVLGIHNGPPVFAVGMLGILFFAAVSLNQIVNETYIERDYLRAHLESEVVSKTASLAKALEDLKTAQAEIISNAKLASLGTLSAGIAHEINNSLNYVRGSLSPLSNLLKRESLTEIEQAKAQKLLSVMNDGLKLTEQIIINLKTYSSRTGTVSYEELLPIVENVLALLKPKLKEKVTVALNIPPDFQVEMDRVCVTQVLSNLIDNACDAMESNSEERILTIAAQWNESHWTLAVTDNGAGIPENIRSQIFDPFFTTKPVGKGTGLGLYIVRSEMAKRGGKIETLTEAGKGTTVILQFAHSSHKEVA
ncbi:MAG: hypothetical protein RIR26_491 [Pseudomonadota bacterium]